MIEKKRVSNYIIRPTSSMRADIQALRAIAVLAVVVYHIWPTRLTGGFMGVDVFFVISGYLMTMTIWKGVRGVAGEETHGFTTSIRFLFSFYAKRIRRLVPAATVLLLSVLLTVYLIGDLSLQKETMPQISASTLFIQNWFLADQAVDYLGSDASATAVQHFWSLSVEEQFYMIWPLLLLVSGLIYFAVIRRKGKTKGIAFPVLMVVCVFTALSFAYGFYYTFSNPALAYFVTPARIWELSLGGIIVFLPQIKHRDLQLLMPWFGLALALYPILRWGGADFPGWHALIPTVGTLLVIWGGSSTANVSSLSVSNLSRFRLAQFFGDISYSLYLWHWPLIVLVPIYLGVDLNVNNRKLKIAIFLTAIIISFLSYYFVERTTRHIGTKSLRPARTTVAVWVSGILCMAMILLPSQLLETRAADYMDNVLQQAYNSATDSNGIGFGARATLHRGESGVPANPFGEGDPKWQYATTSKGAIIGGVGNFSYTSESSSTISPDATGIFGDMNGSTTALVLGDSFSAAWYPALDIAFKHLGIKGIGAYTIYAGGGMFELTSEDGTDKYFVGETSCSIQRANDRFNWIKETQWKNADIIIIAVAPGYFTETGASAEYSVNASQRLHNTISEIYSSTGVKPILMQSPPIIAGKFSDRDLQTRDMISKNPKEWMDFVYAKLLTHGTSDIFTYMRVESLFLDDNGNAHTQIGGVPVYNNYNHINSCYSASCGEYFTKKLQELGV